jgi:hypothetical protein
MKNLKNIVSSLALAMIVSSGSVVLGDDAHRDVTYSHDSKGWIDENHHHHDFLMNKGHRGYYNYSHGKQVWVDVNL